jgi:hypothetical protein
MKLTTTTQLSVDGVMQANGPSEEERRAGFERDGWAMGHFDNESRTREAVPDRDRGVRSRGDS